MPETALERSQEPCRNPLVAMAHVAAGGLESMVASSHKACVLDAQILLPDSSGNTISVASHPAPSASGRQIALMDSHCSVCGRREAVPQVCMGIRFVRV